MFADDPAAAGDIAAWCRLRDQEFLGATSVDGAPAYDVRRRRLKASGGEMGPNLGRAIVAVRLGEPLDEDVGPHVVLLCPTVSSTSVASSEPTCAARSKQLAATCERRRTRQRKPSPTPVGSYASISCATGTWMGSKSRPVMRTPSLPRVVMRISTRSSTSTSDRPVLRLEQVLLVVVGDEVRGAVDQRANILPDIRASCCDGSATKAYPRSRHSCV